MENREYESKVDQLTQSAVSALRDSRGNPDATRCAIQSYLHKGYLSDLSASELIDFFCVSTPNILELVGYNEDDIEQIVAIFDKIHEEYRNAL